jgi:hypothetical protein
MMPGRKGGLSGRHATLHQSTRMDHAVERFECPLHGQPWGGDGGAARCTSGHSEGGRCRSSAWEAAAAENVGLSTEGPEGA